MNRIIIPVLICHCFCSLMYGQNSELYFGKVVNENGTPLEYANAVLLQKIDSSLVDGAVTDSLGYFSIQAKKGEYLLKISFLGCQTQIIDVQNESISTIALIQDTNILQEVTVTAARPVVKMENGGISTEIQNSYLQNLGTAQEVLGQLPFVNAEKEKITVFGKGEPLIYINNKLVRDNSEIEQLNSNRIKKVTVITNPGAEYDASIQSVIRIETLRQQGDGLSGDMMFRTVINRKFSHNETANLNYRHKKWDIFGMFRYGKTGDLVEIEMTQKTQSNSTVTDVRQSGVQVMNQQYYRSNIGTNYVFNDNHSAGMKFQNTGTFVFDFLLDADFTAFKNNVLNEQFHNALYAENKPVSNYLNIYYQGKLAKWISAKLDVDYAGGSGFSGHTVKNYRQDSLETLQTADKNNYELYAAKLTFTSSLWTGELNYGYELSQTTNNQQFNVLSKGESAYLNSTQNTSRQLLNALFFTFSKQAGKFSVNAAIRYENVDFKYFKNEKRKKNQANIIVIFSLRQPLHTNMTVFTCS